MVSNRFKLNNIAAYNTRNKGNSYFLRVHTTSYGIARNHSLNLNQKLENGVKWYENLKTITRFKNATKQRKPHTCPWGFYS